MVLSLSAGGQAGVDAFLKEGFGGKYVMNGYKNVGHTGGMSHMFCWEKRIS